MPTLFVSYARADQAIVLSLVSELRELGYDPFFDQNLTGGQRWWDVLLDRILDAHGFLPVLSEEYRKSEACHLEALWAQNLRVPFVPIDLGQIGPELCEPFIAEANWVRYSLDDRGSVARLARALAAMPPSQRPDPLPDRPAIPISYLAATEQEIRKSPALTIERQLVIIATLRAKLGTNEDTSARTLLAELRGRQDITYSNALDIDGLLRWPATNTPKARPSQSRDQPPPRYQQPQYQQPRHNPPATPQVTTPHQQHPTYQAPVTSPRGPELRTAVAPGLLGIGALLLILTLFAVDWLTLSRSSSSISYDFAHLRSNIGSGGAPGVSVVYFGWLAYFLIVSLLAVAVIAVFWSRNSRRLIGSVFALAALTLLLTIVSTVTLANRAKDSGVSFSYGPGFWMAIVATVAVPVAALVARRRTLS